MGAVANLAPEKYAAIVAAVPFVDALTRAGKPYQLEIQPGQKHGFTGKAALDFRNAAIVEFFEKNPGLVELFIQERAEFAITEMLDV